LLEQAFCLGLIAGFEDGMPLTLQCVPEHRTERVLVLNDEYLSGSGHEGEMLSQPTRGDPGLTRFLLDIGDVAAASLYVGLHARKLVNCLLAILANLLALNWIIAIDEVGREPVDSALKRFGKRFVAAECFPSGGDASAPVAFALLRGISGLLPFRWFLTFSSRRATVLLRMSATRRRRPTFSSSGSRFSRRLREILGGDDLLRVLDSLPSLGFFPRNFSKRRRGLLGFGGNTEQQRAGEYSGNKLDIHMLSKYLIIVSDTAFSAKHLIIAGDARPAA
jgi:hypothetical protein